MLPNPATAITALLSFVVSPRRCNYAAVIVGRLTYAIVRSDRNIEELSDVLALMIDGVNTFGGRIPDMCATAKVQH